MNRGILASTSWLLAALLCAACSSRANSQPRTPAPRNLEDCYLNVAMKKSTADMVHLAREICDAVFKRARESIVVRVRRSRLCEEWWFDSRGRYETAERYCELQRPSPDKRVLACQERTSRAKGFVVDLAIKGDALETVGEPVGELPGEVYKTLAACLRGGK